MKEIGTITYLDPRDIWANEAQNFTPWLCEHLDELDKVLGLSLELINRETKAGLFSCDIFAKDVRSRRKVIIENQLSPSDHSHLGQLMAYAAGLEADIVCWISPEFRDEHTCSINWLNSHTTEDIQFIALRLRAIKIGDSLPAPLFELVAGPNAYQRATKKEEELTELAKYYKDFWDEMLRRLGAAKLYTGTRKPCADSWIGLPAGLSGFTYNLAFAKGNIFRVEVYIDHGTGTKELNEELFERLHCERTQLEAELGLALEWQKLEHATACRIALDKQYTDKESDREILLVWGVEMFGRMKSVFDSRLRELKGK